MSKRNTLTTGWTRKREDAWLRIYGKKCQREGGCSRCKCAVTGGKRA